MILFPINAAKKINGENPIKEVNINLKKDIFSNDKIKFCISSGFPGINLKIIKYSNEELEINLSILLVYLL